MNVSLTISAKFVGSSFASDPELALPSFPRFLPEVVVLPYQETGLLFEGVRGTQVLNGRGARGFVPRLIAGLDGTRPLAELVQAFPPMPPKTVFDALALLHSRGLLEDGVADPEPPTQRETLAFLGRYVDATRVNANRQQALARLARGRLAVAGPMIAAAAVIEALGDLAGGEMRQPARPEDLGRPDLLITLFPAGDPQARAWLDRAWTDGVPALHATVGTDATEIGPILMPGQSACYRCFRARKPEPRPGAPIGVGFWAGIVALHAHHLVSRIGNPNLYDVCHVHTLGADGPRYEDVKISRLPGCPACGLAHVAPSARDPESVIWLLHNAANGVPPQRFLNPRDYQMHYAAANLQITKEVPEPWWGAEPVALPPGRLPEAPPRWAGKIPSSPRPLDAEALASILRCAVGNSDDETRRRIAPSAGGLGSTELFVVVRDLPGLPRSLYRYYAVAHRLERLGIIPDALLAGAIGIGVWNLPPVVLIGACNTAKLQQKYNDFTFRFAALDSGVAQLFIHEVAAALGISVASFPEMREEVLGDAMALPQVGNSYILSFAAGLGMPPVSPPDRELIRPHQYVSRLVSLASSMQVLPAGASAQTGATAPTQPSPPLGALLLQRCSGRTFQDRAVPLDLAVRLARLAEAADAELTAAGGLPIHTRLWLAVNAQSGDAAGIYTLDPATRRPVRLRSGVTPADLRGLMLQHALSEAPLVLLVTGDFGDAVGRFGARGYREMIVRAGAMAARSLLVAESAGLRGCPWGGLTEAGWGPLLSIDRYSDCPLFGVSLGYPDGQ